MKRIPKECKSFEINSSKKCFWDLLYKLLDEILESERIFLENIYGCNSKRFPGGFFKEIWGRSFEGILKRIFKGIRNVIKDDYFKKSLKNFPNISQDGFHNGGISEERLMGSLDKFLKKSHEEFLLKLIGEFSENKNMEDFWRYPCMFFKNPLWNFENNLRWNFWRNSWEEFLN